MDFPSAQPPANIHCQITSRSKDLKSDSSPLHDIHRVYDEVVISVEFHDHVEAFPHLLHRLNGIPSTYILKTVETGYDQLSEANPRLCSLNPHLWLPFSNQLLISVSLSLSPWSVSYINSSWLYIKLPSGKSIVYSLNFAGRSHVAFSPQMDFGFLASCFPTFSRNCKASEVNALKLRLLSWHVLEPICLNPFGGYTVCIQYIQYYTTLYIIYFIYVYVCTYIYICVCICILWVMWVICCYYPQSYIFFLFFV